MPALEVWFQRASDVVRKLVYGDVDLGIVGYDMFNEVAGSNSDLIVLHEALSFGRCHLGLGVPMHGRFAEVYSLDDLRRCVALAVILMPKSPASVIHVNCSILHICPC